MFDERQWECSITALDFAIERGMADVRAGRVHLADDVFDELEAEIRALPEIQPFARHSSRAGER